MTQSSVGKLLAIETSCDETAAAVMAVDKKGVRILSNTVASQILLHRKTLGVVPEIASRAHTEKILAVLEQALRDSKTTLQDIGVVAVTYGPGLVGSLLVGSETAKAIAYARGIPLIAINHLGGHCFSAFAEKKSPVQAGGQILISNIKKSLPALALIVSGGHTELVVIRNMFNYRIVGRTVDDAAGEAFDKIARLLGLPYPGGPAIEAAASKPLATDPWILTTKLPRPMIDSGDFNFSFAGLKTAALYQVRALKKLSKHQQAAFARETQQAIVDVLASKTYRAALQFKVKSVLLAGGVSANKLLRQTLAQKIKQLGLPFHIAPQQLTTDNAAMIGLAGGLRYLAGKTTNWYDVKVNPNAKLDM
ncbi:MAG: tRNA (adenosine(37)-N6)-threonylcarbamoyltransferase complex transferase subunit TsaD [Patescibacteria group bacterium]